MSKTNILALWSLAATVALAGCASRPGGPAGGGFGAQAASRAADPGVIPGVEVLLADSLHLLRGKRVGLITNHSGRDRAGTSTIDLLHRAPGVTLAAIFAPEHGVRGAAEAGETIETFTDSATGIPIYSIYGETRVPTPEMLQKIDILVYDIQDIGARTYTYPWHMALSAEAGAKEGKPFVVLDRPNPIRGDRIEGGVLEPAWRSFVGQYPVALRYGLTPGEMIRYLVGTGQVQAQQVHVVPMKNYRLSMWLDETGLAWQNPSPNIRNLDAALMFTGTVFFEGVSATEGRGTADPFNEVGAAFLTDAAGIARELNAKKMPGVRFDTITRAVKPGFKFGGRTIPMVRVIVTERNRVNPPEVGAHMLRAFYERHKTEMTWRPDWVERLSGSTALREAVLGGDLESLFARWRRESEQFRKDVERYRLYPR